jgi:pimeloyl-ACP methyl ester carboxylesterase
MPNMKIRVRIGLAAAILALAATAATAQPPPPPAGQTVWVDIPAGRLKTRVFQSAKLSEHPVLVVLVHGDIPSPRQGLYELAQAIAGLTDDVVAAGVLRPGYQDAQGETSSGKLGYAIGDNYTPEVVDAVDAAVRRLKAGYRPRRVVIIGHSGGGAISADLLGRHPGDVDAAVLLSCGCNPTEFMERWVREHPVFPRNLPNPSLLPLDLAPKVSPKTRVRMVIGDKDDVVRLVDSQAYAKALQAHGVDAKLAIAPGAGHNDIFLAPETLAAINEILAPDGLTMRPLRAPR